MYRVSGVFEGVLMTAIWNGPGNVTVPLGFETAIDAKIKALNRNQKEIHAITMSFPTSEALTNPWAFYFLLVDLFDEIGNVVGSMPELPGIPENAVA